LIQVVYGKSFRCSCLYGTTISPGDSYIKCRIIGCLKTIDDKGEDAKLILVPSKKVSSYEADIESIEDLEKNMFKLVDYLVKMMQLKFIKILNYSEFY